MISPSEILIHIAIMVCVFSKHFNIKELINFIGIMFTDDNLWKVQRRFSLHHLRNLGFGKKSLEVVIKEEVDELICELMDLEGEPLYIQVI